MLRTHNRQSLLGSLYPMMQAGSEQFKHALLESDIALQTLCEKGETVPELLVEMTSALPDKSRIRTHQSSRKLTGPRPRHEVMRMMARLQLKLEMSNR